MQILRLQLPLALVLAGMCSFAAAEEKGRQLSLSEGNILLTAPSQWEKKQPRTRILDAEFSIPAVGDDKTPGRATVMGAGGSIEANIGRWKGQFTKLADSSVEKHQVAGETVHLIDLSGTYKDQRGPFAPATMRENYRMLGAIIATKKRGQYFVKFYGPKATVEKNEKHFKDMLDSLKVK